MDGCPHEALAAVGLEWCQLVVHPERWVFADAEALLDAKRIEWRDSLSADGLGFGA